MKSISPNSLRKLFIFSNATLYLYLFLFLTTLFVSLSFFQGTVSSLHLSPVLFDWVDRLIMTLFFLSLAVDFLVLVDETPSVIGRDLKRIAILSPLVFLVGKYFVSLIIIVALLHH